MEIEDLLVILYLSMLTSLGVIGWMLYSTHVRNREIVMQRDEIHMLQIQTLELEKLKSIASAEEEQMRRIGRFLHDEVGGNLHVLLHLLEKSNMHTDNESTEILQRASNLTRKSIEAVRSTSQELVPYFLLNFGLTRTLQSMADDAHDLPDLQMRYSDSLQWSPELLPQETTIQFYRLIQEVYSNLLRHAKPSEILIHLSTTSEAITIELTHNGVGLSQQEFTHLLHSGKSLGLKNIDYRSTLLQAEVIYNRLESSSAIRVSIDTAKLQLLPTPTIA
jgi:signal transduction histidine kinase